ncbi:MAG: tetratricopeptide repeat protein, partial [Candidatus Acidiferrales bacterium]
MILPTLLLAFLLGQASAPPAAAFQQAFERGLEALSQGQLEAAETAFQEAAGLQPGSAAVHYQLGEVSVRRGRPGEAIARFRRAIELQPTEPQPYLRLAVLQAQLQRFHDAQETVSSLLRARPG